MSIHLMVQFYQERNDARRAELHECLRRNFFNNWLKEIMVFLEKPEDESVLRETFPQLFLPSYAGRLRVVPHRGRLTYRAAFAFANGVCQQGCIRLEVL